MKHYLVRSGLAFTVWVVVAMALGLTGIVADVPPAALVAIGGICGLLLQWVAVRYLATVQWRSRLSDYERVVHEGEVYPPWYYGAGYYDLATWRAHYYVIPLNYIVRAARWICWRWDRHRRRAGFWVRRDHIQETLNAEYERGKRMGYYSGYDEGRHAVFSQFDRLLGNTTSPGVEPFSLYVSAQVEEHARRIVGDERPDRVADMRGHDDPA